MKIDIYFDYVVVEWTTVPRPSHISRSDWMRWWENAVKCEDFLSGARLSMTELGSIQRSL